MQGDLVNNCQHLHHPTCMYAPVAAVLFSPCAAPPECLPQSSLW